MTLKRILATSTIVLGLATLASAPAANAFSFGNFFDGEKPASEKSEPKFAQKADFKMPELSSEMQALIDQLRAAHESGDEDSVVAIREQIKTLRESEQAARESAEDAAIASGYESWAAWATEQNLPEEFRAKITADNFETFIELRTAQKKVRELSAELGLVGDGMGMKMRAGMGGESRGRMDPFASLTDDEKNQLKSMTEDEREAFLKEKGIAKPERPARDDR